MTNESPDPQGVERKKLAPLVEALYRGVTIDLCGRLVCFRGRGELLPDLPAAMHTMDAVGSGLFVSADVTSGGELVDQKWLMAGTLDDLALTLEELQAPADVVDQVKLQLSFRAYMKNRGSALPVEVRPSPAGTYGRGGPVHEPQPQRERA